VGKSIEPGVLELPIPQLIAKNEKNVKSPKKPIFAFLLIWIYKLIGIYFWG